MLREHAFGGESLAPRLCAVLQDAGFDLDNLQAHVAPHSDRFGQHPNQCLQRAVQDAHTCTWYVVDGLDECHRTYRGSRLGSPLADIAYNITMTSVLCTVLPEQWKHPGLCAAAACVPVFLLWSPGLTIWQSLFHLCLPLLWVTLLSTWLILCPRL